MDPRETYETQLSRESNPLRIAEKFLWLSGYIENGDFILKYYRGFFYKYDKTCYKVVSRDNLRIEALAFLQGQRALVYKATRSQAENIIENVSALTQVPENADTPCFLNAPGKEASQIICMKNGIFDVDKFKKGLKPLSPHTQNFFSFNSLPFDYNPKAQCPRWIKFLEASLPEKDLQNLMQEWVGYCLTEDVAHHYFILMVGSGANGKSVICTVLRTLLGKENVSAISLEQFNPERTFPLHAMIGKKANIVEEIGDVHKVAEGVLKNIVSGGEMTCEQKGRDPVLVKFRTKLVFATNVVPRFRDRSDALWRRIIFVPFKVQILDPKKQNRNFVDSSWWVNSGEMSGILNWALNGLRRLKERGYFIEPQSSMEMKEEYKKEANPAVVFILENCEVKAGGNLCTSELYYLYARSIKSQGGMALSKGMFTREVGNAFPTARMSQHARVQKNGPHRFSKPSRSRVWENLRLKP